MEGLFSEKKTYGGTYVEFNCQKGHHYGKLSTIRNGRKSRKIEGGGHLGTLRDAWNKGHTARVEAFVSFHYQNCKYREVFEEDLKNFGLSGIAPSILPSSWIPGNVLKAGWGIEAGLSIRCNLTIKWAYNLFAGVAHWKKAEGADIEIEAKELLGGDLKYGKFVKTKGTVQKMYWHIHHEVLMEYLTEPLKNRIEYIKTNKPEHERDIRLKLLKAVKAPLS